MLWWKAKRVLGEDLIDGDNKGLEDILTSSHDEGGIGCWLRLFGDEVDWC